LIEKFEPFAYGFLSDSIANKGLLYTKIKVGNDKFLHVVNSHLNASYVSPELERSEVSIDTRMKQIAFIKDFVNYTFEEQNIEDYQNNLVLICGDLNIDAFADKENE